MDNFNWCFIPKPQKIADSNLLGFKDWQQLKSAFFGGPSIFSSAIFLYTA
ncbi:MAG: hypothetical protein LBS83_02285 [Holosporales bacterium]|nr:hypothetical protein [Holosporales bacterium]